VLHAPSEDLEVFQHWLGVLPEPLFDTQLAAAFVGEGFSLGYAGLGKAILGVEIPKGETRSNWLQRPLSVAQKRYAALDVAHMLVIYGKLLQRLRSSGRLDWAKAESADLVAKARQEPEPEDYYRKLGSAWKLHRRELAVLRQVCAWREREARRANRPRNRLLKEAGLWELARRQPVDLGQLRALKEIPARTLRDYGETLLEQIELGRNQPEPLWPEPLPAPLGRAEAPFLKTLKAHVRHLAERLALPPELLARKRDYEALVRSGLNGGEFVLPPSLEGWRRDLLGDSLLEVARAHRNDLVAEVRQ